MNSLNRDQWKELVKEIMQTGFDIAMGGDCFLSEKENKELQEKRYDEAVDKYVSELEKVRQETIEELKEIIEDDVIGIFNGNGLSAKEQRTRLDQAISAINNKKAND